MLRLDRIRAGTFAAGLAAAVAYPALSAPAAADLPGVFVSRQLAEDASIRTGDTVTLATDASGAGARQFRVDGTYEPTPDPMRFSTRRLEARMHLPDLNTLTAATDDGVSAESVNAINVRLADGANADAFAATLAARARLGSSRGRRRAPGTDPIPSRCSSAFTSLSRSSRCSAAPRSCWR